MTEVVKDEFGKIRRFVVQPTQARHPCTTFKIIEIDGNMGCIPTVGDIINLQDISAMAINGNIVSVLPPADPEAAEQERIKWL